MSVKGGEGKTICISLVHIWISSEHGTKQIYILNEYLQESRHKQHIQNDEDMEEKCTCGDVDKWWTDVKGLPKITWKRMRKI